jgi:4-amino-4-deoxy-L-arabinose transferase-like glycosyltransferase
LKRRETEVQIQLASQIKNKFNRWRLALLVLMIIYVVVLSMNLSFMATHWDEINHFTGGLHLIRGQIIQYFLTSSFYPPVFNLVTAGYFMIGGASVFTARLVAVTFSTLSLLAVYAIAERMYNSKTALLSAIFLGVMPGIVWVSRIALIETMLIFIFSITMLFFFLWLTTGRKRDRIISAAALAIGIAIKYQMLVLVPIIMVADMIVFDKRQYLKNEIIKLLKFPKVILTITAIAVLAIVFFTIFATKIIDPWLFSILVGPTERSLYSVRFPAPIFYLVELTWALSFVHPISIFLYIVGLAGIVLFICRRKPQDKFLLMWFAVVYLVFTIIPNREWRYVTPLFPVLAISAASIITLGYGTLQKVWQSPNIKLSRKRLAKLTALILVGLTAASAVYSCVDAYYWVKLDEFQVPVEQASDYVLQSLRPDQSVAVACPVNVLNDQMVWFCLNTKAPNPSNVWQYPALAVDAYTPNFNTTEFMTYCQQNNTRYVFLYEYGNNHFFNSTLTEPDIFRMLNSTGRYTLQATFGTELNRIFILCFE